MTVKSLGYIGITCTDLEAWAQFAGQVLGVQVDRVDGGLRLRVDDWAWRIAVTPGDTDDIAYAGWDVGTPAALDALAERLRAVGIYLEHDSGLARARGVLGLARFTDPAGVRTELFWGPSLRTEQPMVSPVGVSGFVTGAQGLGHIVLAVPDADAMLRFYRDTLGFGLSDVIDMPVGPGMVLPVTFTHCNTRHHSLAFAPAPSPKKLIHLMLQTAQFDDVGFALDRVKRHDVKLSLTLGRHANDLMVSFYAYTPSGFEIEYGWGARTLDPATWLPARHDRISMWGHEFVGIPGSVQA